MPHPVMLIDVDFSAFSFWNRVKAAYRLLTGKRVCTLTLYSNADVTVRQPLQVAQQATDKIEITDINKN